MSIRRLVRISFLAAACAENFAIEIAVYCSSIAEMCRRHMHKSGLSKAETRILEQYWKLGTCFVREIPDSLPEDERVAYTTVQTLVYGLEQKGALRAVGRGVQPCNAWGVLGNVSHTACCFADEHVATVTLLPDPVSCRRQIADHGQLKSLP